MSSSNSPPVPPPMSRLFRVASARMLDLASRAPRAMARTASEKNQLMRTVLEATADLYVRADCRDARTNGHLIILRITKTKKLEYSLQLVTRTANLPFPCTLFDKYTPGQSFGVLVSYTTANGASIECSSELQCEAILPVDEAIQAWLAAWGEVSAEVPPSLFCARCGVSAEELATEELATSGKSLRACPTCRHTVYCSEACLLADAARHYPVHCDALRTAHCDALRTGLHSS